LRPTTAKFPLGCLLGKYHPLDQPGFINPVCTLLVISGETNDDNEDPHFEKPFCHQQMTESTDICFRVTAGYSRLQAVGNQGFFEALGHNHTSQGWLKHGFYGFLWF